MALACVLMGLVAWIFYALTRKSKRTRKKSNARNGAQEASGREIYEILINELKGPVGKTAKTYFIEGCARCPTTSEVPIKALNYVRSKTISGERPEGIARRLPRYLPGLGKQDLERIARSISAIAQTSLTRSRSEQVGAYWYAWSTCQDQRVRKSHALMQGVLVAWSDPPSPEELNGEPPTWKYHPGHIEGCRCDVHPIISLDQIKWPARAYRQNRIVAMERKEFARIWKP